MELYKIQEAAAQAQVEQPTQASAAGVSPIFVAEDEKKRLSKCYQCDAKGHIARDCPLRGSSPACTFCGRQGHLVQYCRVMGRVARQRRMDQEPRGRADSRQTRCGVCDRTGHTSSQCRRRDRPRSDRRDYNRERRGGGDRRARRDEHRRDGHDARSAQVYQAMHQLPFHQAPANYNHFWGGQVQLQPNQASVRSEGGSQ